jgi:galactonate dehydratase
MDVRDYDLYAVPPRWLLLRLETADGQVGWGEPVVEGRGPTVRAAVEELVEDYLLGEDPTPVADHWERLYRGGFYRGGPVLMSAIAGIDQALWDLKGKQFGAPVHELLGGPVRDRVKAYRWVGGDRPAEAADQATAVVEEGFGGVKMNATGELRMVDTPAKVEAAAERLRAVRAAVGDEVDVGVDFHGRVAKPMAKRLTAALEPHDPMFVEEPVLPEHNDWLPELAASTTVPIATGERMYHRTDFRDVLASGVVDVIQPDLSHAGGITECHRIAAMADAHDVALAPHCPLGPVALAACLQLDAVAHNALIQETSIGIHYNESAGLRTYLEAPELAVEDGFVSIPDGPGLGIEVDREAVETHAGDPEWHNPVWRHDDGSVAEW